MERSDFLTFFSSIKKLIGIEIFAFFSVNLKYFSIEVLSILFVYFFFGVLDLHCSAHFSLVSASRGYPLVVVHEFLTVVASLILEALGRMGFSSCGTGLSSCGSHSLEHKLNSCGAQA